MRKVRNILRALQQAVQQADSTDQFAVGDGAVPYCPECNGSHDPPKH